MPWGNLSFGGHSRAHRVARRVVLCSILVVGLLSAWSLSAHRDRAPVTGVPSAAELHVEHHPAARVGRNRPASGERRPASGEQRTKAPRVAARPPTPDRCPVDRPRWYRNDFGAPRTAGGPHAHAGIDIVAPKRTPVRAPFDGILRRTPNRIGGRALKLYARGGYLYMAHMHAYGAPEGRVKRGTILAYVGTTGAARGTAPHNHLEWHPRGKRDKVANPLRLLRKLCGTPTKADFRASGADRFL